MSRTSLFVSLLALILIGVVSAFSFLFLIPKGKEYRKLRIEYKKELATLDATKEYHKDVTNKLITIKKTNKKTIDAFQKKFNPKEFENLYKKDFNNLYLTELKNPNDDGSFKVYEVNATTKIYSPQSFYNFLASVNDSGWIIEVNFPINFQSDNEMINASFTMRVYNKPSDRFR